MQIVIYLRMFVVFAVRNLYGIQVKDNELQQHWITFTFTCPVFSWTDGTPYMI